MFDERQHLGAYASWVRYTARPLFEAFALTFMYNYYGRVYAVKLDQVQKVLRSRVYNI